MHPPSTASTSLFGQLRQRRMVPLVGGYIAAMWLLIELLDFAGGRYGIDSRWVDLAFAMTWLLLPGMLLVFWRVGPPGDAVWRRGDAWLLGANALLALAGGVLVWTLRATEALPVAVPEAVAEARTPLAQVQQRGSGVLMLPLQAWDPGTGGAGSASPPPLALAVTALVDLDLMFDERIALRTLGNGHLPGARALFEKLEVQDVSRVPLSVQRRIAETHACSGLIQARYRQAEDGGLEVEVSYLALTPQRQMETEHMQGLDPWEVAERIADGARRHFARGEPYETEYNPSLRAVSSDSLDAVLAFAQGAFDLYHAQQVESGLAHLKQAMTLDPQFSLAVVTYAYATPAQMDVAATREALQRAVLRSASLPERVRLSVQARALLADGDIERAREVYQLWAKRHPQDPTPARWLAEDQLRENPFDETALLRLQEALTAQPDITQRRTLAERWHRLGRFEQALALLEQDGRTPVEDYALLHDRARVLGSMGRIDEALMRLRMAETLQPDTTNPLLYRAWLLFAQDQADEALTTLDAAAARAGSDAERAAVLGLRIPMLLELGRAGAIPDLLAEHEHLLRASALPGQVLHGHHMAMFEAYAFAHGVEAAMRWFEAELTPLPELSRFRYQATLMTMAGSRSGDLDLLERGLRDLDASEQPDPNQVARLWRASLEARRASLSGDRELALQRYAEAMERERLDWASGRSNSRIAPRLSVEAIDAALLAGDPGAAADWVRVLKAQAPGYPRSALVLARWHLALGEVDAAAAWLARADRNLQQASAGYELLTEAGRLRQLLAESRSTASET